GPGHLLPAPTWRWPGRAADDEPRLEQTVLGQGLVPSLDDGQKKADRLFALAADRLVHRGQRRVDELGKVDIVEPDDADVTRDLESKVAQRTHRPDGHGVAHG